MTPLVTPRPSPWLTRDEAAEYLRLSRSRLAHLAVTGGGPKFHRARNSRPLYHINDLDAYLGAPVSSTTEAGTRDRELAAA